MKWLYLFMKSLYPFMKWLPFCEVTTLSWSDSTLSWSDSTLLGSDSTLLWSNSTLSWTDSTLLWNDSILLWSDSNPLCDESKIPLFHCSESSGDNTYQFRSLEFILFSQILATRTNIEENFTVFKVQETQFQNWEPPEYRNTKFIHHVYMLNHNVNVFFDIWTISFRNIFRNSNIYFISHRYTTNASSKLYSENNKSYQARYFIWCAKIIQVIFSSLWFYSVLKTWQR